MASYNKLNAYLSPLAAAQNSHNPRRRLTEKGGPKKSLFS